MTDDYLDDPEIVQLFVEYAGIDASELELGMRNMLDALNPAEIPKEKAQIAAERMKLAAQKCALDGKIDRLSELEEGYIQLSSEKGLFEVKKEGLFRKSAAIPEHDKHYFSHLNTIAEYTGASSCTDSIACSSPDPAPVYS
ncbi:MAG: hypothetical protein U9P44_04285, partial [archaeon]|nr:hypothetical protein [archaeon]